MRQEKEPVWKPRRILMSGAGGLLGRHIASERRAAGDTVVPLARGTGPAGAILWDPARGALDPRSVSGYDAVIHLAGEPVTGLWTTGKKRRIRHSRVGGTTLLARALAAAEHPPTVFLCASGANYYGHRGDQVIDESEPAGTGFLAEVAAEWEAACDPLREVSRVANLRIGVVLARDGGTLPLTLPLFRLGLGGWVGDGRAYLSWIGINDLVRATAFALDCPSIEGAVNFVAPQAVTGRQFARELAAAAGRSAAIHVPSWLVRMTLGELAEETVLNSIRAVPRRLLEAGFRFGEDTLAKALAACVLP